ncbi:DUF655 domain-containing protein [Massilia sp. TS11]|uniref:ComEA family DNA-binding protein n=1 Tax=Massilia sp. TS11 TaxID=2908003 RepID=UPI001EDB657A|nr:DUF655 domain-containing protein [Massilia sp. TS11]MCG2585576.1 helix-hairpin-helix domain-containing protein [Massilia sp. TS11]
MLTRLISILALLAASAGVAFAQVEVNKADKAALDSIKGIGPKMSQEILDERTQHGDFKDWTDFQSRIKGVKEKKAQALSKAGLQINGKAKDGADAALAKAPKAGK